MKGAKASQPGLVLLGRPQPSGPWETGDLPREPGWTKHPHVGEGRRTSAGGSEGSGGFWIALGTGAALVLAVWVAALWRGGEAGPAALPLEHGRLAVTGLEAPLRIDRNRRGVPQLRAGSERDAWFGLGFSHAQDRLGQLLELRARVQGRVAERVGPSALDSDRTARVLGLTALAEAQWRALPRSARRALEAYSAGVNARLERIARGEAAAPPGFADPAPEPWRPVDSLALFKFFSWNLGASVDASLVLRDLVAELGAPDAQRFFPPRLDAASAGRSAAAPAWLPRGLQALRSAGGLDGLGVGSAAFVVGGAHTASGNPALVAESHTAPTLPAPFYLAHLKAPDLDVAGLTLPGVPVFWSGRNPSLAWAAVHVGAVVTDLYVETLRRDGQEYHDGRRWRALERRTETIAVRGQAPVELTVAATSRGPLLPSVLETSGEGISLRWTGARVEGPSGIASFQALGHARNGEMLREALAGHREPVVAVVWAHRDGSAGLQVAGWIPRRSLASQLLPLPGRAPWYQWSERVAYADLPAPELEAGVGFLVAADQPFAVGDEGASVDALWRPGVRARRLASRLAELVPEHPELRELTALQSDLVLVRSRRVLERALAFAESAELGKEARALVELLQSWDGRASVDSPGCSAYHSFLTTLARELFAGGLGEPRYAALLSLPSLDLEGLVAGVLGDAAAGGVDRWSEPEPVRAAVVRSLGATWLALAYEHGPDPRHWRWGGLHELHFRDPLGLEPPLGPFPMAGAPHAVFAGGFAPGRSFDVNVTATARLAVDLGAPDLLLTALAPGQSELRGHDHFESGLPGWLSGRHALLATRAVEIDEYSTARLHLEPLQ